MKITKAVYLSADFLQRLVRSMLEVGSLYTAFCVLDTIYTGQQIADFLGSSFTTAWLLLCASLFLTWIFYLVDIFEVAFFGGSYVEESA